MVKKIVGWGLVGLGVVGALLGLPVIIGGEMGDGGTMLGIGAVLTATGWPLRNPHGAVRLSDDSGYDLSDSSDTDDASDSGSDSDGGGDSGGD